MAFAVIGVLIFVFWKWNQRYDTSRYSENYVSLTEVEAELAFGIYDMIDWNEYFGTYHEKVLTGKILSELLNWLGVDDYIEYELVVSNAAVTREQWNLVYIQILDLVDSKEEVQTNQMLVLELVASEEGHTIVTNKGEFSIDLPERYLERWQGYEFYVVADKIIGVARISDAEQYISNAYMASYKESKVSFLFQGNSYEKEIGTLGDVVEEGVCDIVIQSGEICALRMKKDTIQGELLSYDDETVELSGYGRVAHAERLPVYQIYGEVTEKSFSDIVLGNMNVTYVTGDNQICAILIEQPANIADIRVLLLSADGTNFRQDVYLKCDTNATLTCGDKTENLTPETIVSAAVYISGEETHTLSITPDFTEGTVIVCDAQGKPISNGYHGTMEVRSYAEGYTLVNEVPFETYLTAVVPSEMPSSYAPEALKAQAVCARSYAYIQLLRADLAEYGAHINDSTSYQVYNKVVATDASKMAVQETAGQMLLYQGQPVEAFYFSTSMGYTDTDEVWNVEQPYGYLKSSYLNTEGEKMDLSNDEAFLAYISQPANGYDSDIKYYRWYAEADYNGKTTEINQILLSRQAVSPRNIQFLREDGVTERDNVSESAIAKLGDVVGLSVQERSSAGSILTLCVEYENGIALVKNEYNIRKVLGTGIKKMVYADSSESTSVNMLPSAFCALVEQEDGSILLQGGGYGHGLGMSQNAANGMAKAGMGYEEILQFFYQDIKISSVE